MTLGDACGRLIGVLSVVASTVSCDPGYEEARRDAVDREPATLRSFTRSGEVSEPLQYSQSFHYLFVDSSCRSSRHLLLLLKDPGVKNFIGDANPVLLLFDRDEWARVRRKLEHDGSSSAGAADSIAIPRDGSESPVLDPELLRDVGEPLYFVDREDLPFEIDAVPFVLEYNFTRQRPVLDWLLADVRIDRDYLY